MAAVIGGDKLVGSRSDVVCRRVIGRLPVWRLFVIAEAAGRGLRCSAHVKANAGHGHGDIRRAEGIVGPTAVVVVQVATASLSRSEGVSVPSGLSVIDVQICRPNDIKILAVRRNWARVARPCVLVKLLAVLLLVLFL